MTCVRDNVASYKEGILTGARSTCPPAFGGGGGVPTDRIDVAVGLTSNVARQIGQIGHLCSDRERVWWFRNDFGLGFVERYWYEKEALRPNIYSSWSDNRSSVPVDRGMSLSAMERCTSSYRPTLFPSPRVVFVKAQLKLWLFACTTHCVIVPPAPAIIVLMPIMGRCASAARCWLPDYAREGQASLIKHQVEPVIDNGLMDFNTMEIQVEPIRS